MLNKQNTLKGMGTRDPFFDQMPRDKEPKASSFTAKQLKSQLSAINKKMTMRLSFLADELWTDSNTFINTYIIYN